MNISAVIITLNEEKNIGRCLGSIQKIADEIIVVDSFSEDQTEKICRDFKVRFYQNEFPGHIEQKNYAISLAKYDYILSLDADEALSEKLTDEIIRVKNSLNKEAYSIKRLNNYRGKWIKNTSWYPDRKIRLWNKSTGSWGGKNPHDKVALSPDTMVVRLRGPILHHSFQSKKAFIDKMRYFAEIAAKNMKHRSSSSLFLKSILHPIWRFLKDYLFLGGFLSGQRGFEISQGNAYYAGLKYRIAYKIKQKK